MRTFPGYMNGVNFGGWLSQCVHTKEHYDSFIHEEDFKVVASWGCDHVRLPIDYNVVQNDDGTFKPEGFVYIDNAIKWAKAANLHLILDLHKTCGYVFDVENLTGGFFFEEKLQENFYILWEEFAKRYAQFQDMLCFELLNEVTSPTFSDTWNKIIYKVCQRIRNISKTVTILVGGYWNNSIDALKDLDAPFDENIVYNFHCYDPLLITHQGAEWINGMPKDLHIPYPCELAEHNKVAEDLNFRDFIAYGVEGHPKFDKEYFINKFARGIKVCEERNVPIYCGEYGTIVKMPAQDSLNWYKDINAAFEHFGMGRASWTYKSMSFGLIDDHMKPVFDEVIKLL